MDHVVIPQVRNLSEIRKNAARKLNVLNRTIIRYTRTQPYVLCRQSIFFFEKIVTNSH